MSDRKYTLPGMPDWSFRPPMLWHKGGAGFEVTAATSAQDIADGVKKILRKTTLTPDDAAYEVVAQAAMNINWQAILNPYVPLIAPLLNAATATPVQNSISTELIDELCEHLKAVYYPLQKIRS